MQYRKKLNVGLDISSFLRMLINDVNSLKQSVYVNFIKKEAERCYVMNLWDKVSEFFDKLFSLGNKSLPDV